MNTPTWWQWLLLGAILFNMTACVVALHRERIRDAVAYLLSAGLWAGLLMW